MKNTLILSILWHHVEKEKKKGIILKWTFNNVFVYYFNAPTILSIDEQFQFFKNVLKYGSMSAWFTREG